MEKSSRVVLFLVVLLFVQGLQSCFCRNSTFGCIERERDCLLQLKQSFSDSSNRFVSWSGNDCCHWNGVSCDQNTGHIVKLDLRAPSSSAFDLFGYEWVSFTTYEKVFVKEVNSCLVELNRLEYLDLSGNDFNQTPIPKFIGSLKHLRYLNLSGAGFGGMIPVQLGNLTSLQILDLSHPHYQAAYADNIHWVSGLSSLKHLNVSFMDLSKALDVMQVLSTLPSLINLGLNGCGIQNIHFSRNSLNSTFLTRVQVLGLSYNSLTGTIPTALHNMTALRELYLSYQEGNYYSGGLYADNLQWVSRLSSLQHLYMSFMNLSKALDLMQVLSTLPSLINLGLNSCGIQNIHFSRNSLNSTSLTRVQVLGLSYNSLTGPIPTALHNMTALRELYLSSGGLYADNLQWVSRLSSLQHLDMSSVNLSKALDLMQVLSALPSLLELRLLDCGIRKTHFTSGFNNSTFFRSIQFLDLGGNGIDGPIPNALQNMTAIKVLDLSNNHFNSTIPLWLVNSKSLVDLNLRRNQFENIEGGMLSMLNEACSLRSLYLSHNSFLGEVLGSIKNSSRCLDYDLEFLSLSYCGISGNWPDYLGQLKDLKALDLSENFFHGPIPSSFGELSMLKSLYFSGNQMTGTIPQFLGRLSALEHLSLSYNQLNGIIPHWLGRLPTLQELDLSNNQLYGIIPSGLGRLPALQELDLSHNQLYGIIPSGLGRLPALQKLDLSNNQLYGIIPSGLGRLPALQALDLSDNRLNGTVPQTLGKLTTLSYLGLSRNQLTGFIPSSLGQLTKLWELDLSSNSLQGVVSELNFANVTWLSIFDLSMNKISGELPMNIEDRMPAGLSTLLLGNNLLNGSIPNSLCQLERLEVLDLSRNMLAGEVPRCWRDTQWLYVVDLSYNKLSGLIPKSIGHLLYLKRLHIEENNLTGKLPLSLSNCKDLEILDLGENKFFGSIPTWIGESLSSLQILRLRNNMVNGSIPSQLCQLGKLQILDLADNNLEGRIPRCFGKLTGMVTENTTVQEPQANSSKSLDKDTGWHREKVREVTKGVDLEYTKMQLKLLDVMDLSINKLVGVIPEELCLLSGLRGLNLSHNHLSGNIPNKIGELKLLESLDLSNNNLSGSIPPSMSTLPSISHLNLSHNNLSGKIPTSNQLQTLDDQSIYAGNLQLCGKPLPTKCPGDDDSVQPPKSTRHGEKDCEEDKKEKILFYFVVLAGYATAVKVARLKKMMEWTNGTEE
ncbi:hypothetical protein TIFTF001_026834 [Ficus carica]|uniref:Leucine-rich repeat-containing N-terminal plant-type domain-containing protein n=1 Tax=Ficus carica TaxID=3494 RepID=A0AA88DLW0_FICCA|nr:hypothetical protein TIFTF001_026834 [Ficus carica]